MAVHNHGTEDGPGIGCREFVTAKGLVGQCMINTHYHITVQHRDGKPPWCDECGLTAGMQKPETIFSK